MRQILGFAKTTVNDQARVDWVFLSKAGLCWTIYLEKLVSIPWIKAAIVLEGVLTDSSRLRFSAVITIINFRLMLSTKIASFFFFKEGINRACRTFQNPSCMDLPADALVTAEQSSCTECLSIISVVSPSEDHLGLSEKRTFKELEKPYEIPESSGTSWCISLSSFAQKAVSLHL